MERGHRGVGAGQPATASARPKGGSVRRAVGLAGDVGEAAHRLGQGAEAGPGASTGPVWPKPVTRDHDEAGVDGRAGRPQPRPQRSSVPGRKFSISDVGVGREPAQRRRRRPAWLQVERDARLLRVTIFHHSATPSLTAPQLRRRVAARVLDLDHVGAVVAQVHRGGGAREQRGAVEHPQARQRARGSWPATGCSGSGTDCAFTNSHATVFWRWCQGPRRRGGRRWAAGTGRWPGCSTSWRRSRAAPGRGEPDRAEPDPRGAQDQPAPAAAHPGEARLRGPRRLRTLRGGAALARGRGRARGGRPAGPGRGRPPGARRPSPARPARPPSWRCCRRRTRSWSTWTRWRARSASATARSWASGGRSTAPPPASGSSRSWSRPDVSDLVRTLQLTRHTRRTTTSRELLRRRLEAIRARAWLVTVDEFVTGAGGAAARVYGARRPPGRRRAR